jgi:O-acetyl-ADP-ribose deacetylase (regulator of RNase III)
MKATLEVVQGNVVDVDADVIVVSANTHLDFEGAAARALEPICGKEAQERFAPLRFNTEVGDIIQTTAGSHPHATWVAWAVVRDYRRGGPSPRVGLKANISLIWKTALAIAGSVDRPDGRRRRIAMIPLNAQDIGLETSATLLQAAFAAAVGRLEIDAWLISPLEAEVATMRDAISGPVV